MGSFDRLAPYYDFLARLVFGKSIVEAQEYFLSEIKQGERILILGGGTGWILDSIFKIANPGEIWYVDSSSKMIEQSKSRARNSLKVHFILGTEKEIPQEVKFDVVITNFFLDIFSTTELTTLIGGIKTKLNPQGIWLCADFVDTAKWKHRILICAMYSFFKVMTKLENRILPDWEGNLLKEGMILQRKKYFWGGFIKSVVLKNAKCEF